MGNHLPSLAPLAAFAEAFGFLLVPTDQPKPATASDGRQAYVFIPASASPVEQGRQLAAFLKDAFSARKAS